MFRRRSEELEVLLVHPGGPLWANKDAAAWSIPKGEYMEDEEPFSAACREFAEELGFSPAGDFRPLGEVRQSGGKLVLAWAVEGDCDPAAVRSNTFTMEWPPRSGKRCEFPEIDRAGWFSLPAARAKINPGQLPLLDRLAEVARP
jgi:predicted NUDIX family NTP pyrophosphohydrolase